MSKIGKNIYRSIKESNHTTLDTLELTSDYFISESHGSQYHKAIRKKSTIAKLKQLIDVAPKDRKKQYWKTWHCDRVKLQQGNKIQGSLCRKRWCQHCNRIKTAELIGAYHKPLIELSEADTLYFVTLTAPTVKARQLRSELKKRYKAFTRIKDNARKNHGVKLVGIRKTEVTYNEAKDHYHPHFHLIVQGKSEAELIQALWLNQFDRASINAQDIRAIDTTDSSNLIEIFKYATKDVTKDTTTAKAMDTIYTALQGIRTIQTYGSIRKVKEPKEAKEETAQIDWIEPRNEIWVYEATEADYFNAYNERLIGTKYINQQYEHDNEASEERNHVFNENEPRTKETI
jgi:hypothetical protein